MTFYSLRKFGKPTLQPLRSGLGVGLSMGVYII